MINSEYVLGIDTSNYKTSVAVTDNRKNIICDCRRFLKVKQGERGLRQSDALFQHIKNLPELMEEVTENFRGNFSAVAYSSKPRPVEGSYMPVFLAGESFARAIAAVLDIPCLAYSHQEGHLEAVKKFGSHKLNNEKQFLACHFSGGTCEVVKVSEKGDSVGYDIEIAGGSKDISFGQVLDRAGVALGLEFPPGEIMDTKIQKVSIASSHLTAIKVSDGWLNLSGIDTQIKNFISRTGLENVLAERIPLDSDKEIQVSAFIREIFEKTADAVSKMVIQTSEKTGLTDIIMAGGVSSSRFIRDRLSQDSRLNNINIIFDTKGLSQDNAVGTALLGGKHLWD